MEKEPYQPTPEEIEKAENIIEEDSRLYPNQELKLSSNLRERAVENANIFTKEGFSETGKELLDANQDFDRARRFFGKLAAPLSEVRYMIMLRRETPKSTIKDVSALFEEAREVRQSLLRYGIHFTMEPLRTALYGFNSEEEIGIPKGHDNDVGWTSKKPPTIEKVEKEFARLEEYGRWLESLQRFSGFIGDKFAEEARGD